MASREMRGLPGGGIASEGGWGGARGDGLWDATPSACNRRSSPVARSRLQCRGRDDRGAASGRTAPPAQRPPRGQQPQPSARVPHPRVSSPRRSRMSALTAFPTALAVASSAARPRGAPRAPRAPLARGTSSGPTPASSPRRRVAACVARRRRAGKPKRPSARSTPSSRGPRTSPSPSPRCAIPRGTGVPTRASRSITSIIIQPPPPSASPTCALSSPRADPPLTLARSSLIPPPPRGHAAHQEPAPKPDPNERKPGEVSEAMKARLRDEYVGLGGTPSKPMPSNLFLNIILGISALAVLCKLGGIL